MGKKLSKLSNTSPLPTKKETKQLLPPSPVVTAIENLSDENHQFRFLLCGLLPCCTFCVAPYQIVSSCRKMTWKSRVWNTAALLYLVFFSFAIGFSVHLGLTYTQDIVDTITTEADNIFTMASDAYDAFNDFDLDDIKNQFNNITNQVDEMHLNVEDITNQVDEMTMDVEKITSKVDNVTSKVDEIKSNVNNIKSDVESISLKTDNIQSKVEGISLKTDNITTEVESLSLKTDNLTVDVKNIQTIVNEIKSG